MFVHRWVLDRGVKLGNIWNLDHRIRISMAEAIKWVLKARLSVVCVWTLDRRSPDYQFGRSMLGGGVGVGILWVHATHGHNR